MNLANAAIAGIAINVTLVLEFQIKLPYPLYYIPRVLIFYIHFKCGLGSVNLANADIAGIAINVNMVLEFQKEMFGGHHKVILKTF